MEPDGANAELISDFLPRRNIVKWEALAKREDFCDGGYTALSRVIPKNVKSGGPVAVAKNSFNGALEPLPYVSENEIPCGGGGRPF
jgi:hypothetical protein